MSVRRKVLTSLLIGTLVLPMQTITANAGASAPMTSNYLWDTTYNSMGNWQFDLNFNWDENGNFSDEQIDLYSGKTDITWCDPSVGLTGEERFNNNRNRLVYLSEKAKTQADNPAMPFIKVPTKDFLCIYGLMYGDLGSKYEGCYFDSARYAADYPDIVAAVGNSHTALWNHFKTSGIYEGRKGYAVIMDGCTINSKNIYWDLADVWNAQMTDRDIVTWVNKWICDHYYYDHIKYNNDLKGIPTTVDTHIPGKYGDPIVCGGYSELFVPIMQNLGIPAIYISDGVKEPGQGHAWNQVYVDGQWKVVDVTWNDGDRPNGEEGPDLNVYLMSDHHPRESLFVPMGGTDNHYKTENMYDINLWLNNSF